MSNFASKLVLGSANFGLNYGLSNKGGRINHAELDKILTQANSMGINIIDTAQAYGDSEARIGSLNKGRFEIVTKIGADFHSSYHVNNVVELVKMSCNRLNQSKLYAVMLHRPEVLLNRNGPEIIEHLQYLKDKNIILKIGLIPEKTGGEGKF